MIAELVGFLKDIASLILLSPSWFFYRKQIQLQRATFASHKEMRAVIRECCSAALDKDRRSCSKIATRLTSRDANR